MNVTHWLVIGLTLGGRATNRFLTHNREVWHLMTTQRLDHSPPFSGLEDVDQADGSALQPGWQEWQDPDHLWRRGGEWLYGPAGYSKSKLQTRIFLKSMVTITVAVSGPKARDRSQRSVQGSFHRARILLSLPSDVSSFISFVGRIWAKGNGSTWAWTSFQALVNMSHHPPLRTLTVLSPSLIGE